ncbi:MAG: transposase [bacterium]|nr:transposase [bacterium]
MDTIKNKESKTLVVDRDLIRSAARKMHGFERRAFMAEISLEYCNGSPRKTERMFGWARDTVETGLGETRSGIICLGAQSTHSGAKLWEESYPLAAKALVELAEYHSQQDSSFMNSIAFTRLTAKEALKQLKEQGFSKKELPSPSTMGLALNRLGYRLRNVDKARPLKKIPETDAIFENVKKR